MEKWDSDYLKKMIQTKEQMKIDVRKIEHDIHLHLSQIIIDFLSEKGFEFVKVRGRREEDLDYMDLWTFELGMKDKKATPQIFADMQWKPGIVFFGRQEYGEDGIIIRDLHKPSSHCSWYIEKEDIETFWDRKLRKLFKVKN